MQHITWSDISYLLYGELLLAGFFVAIYEMLRHKTYLYSTRAAWVPHRAAPTPPRRPFGWVLPVLSTGGKKTRELIGLEAYMMLRFVRLCTRITLFDSILGCAVLLPIYCTGGDRATGFNALTLNTLIMETR